MKVIRKILYWSIKFLKSKVAVIMALLALIGVGVSQKASASSSNYNFATVFQYYMLDNRADNVKDQSQNKKLAYVAPLGSGGITGSFSYDDIVNSAPNVSGADYTAEEFVSMMATYSTFKYFSNRVQGFESIMQYIGRSLLVILIPISLIMDFVNMLVPALLKILAKINIIPFLGSVLTNMTINSGMMGILGLSKETVSTWVDVLLALAISFILFSLFMTLRKGSGNIDQHHFNKLKGRVFTLLFLPVVIGGGATLLNTIGDMTNKMPSVTTDFTRYLVDDRSWAYNYNFAPLGNSSKESDIKPSNKSSFVDLDFDPYTDNGAQRIEQINKNSSIAGDGTLFKNTSLLLAYVTGQAFTANDYIDFSGSEQSMHLLNQTGGNPTYGSYYEYAKNFGVKNILDVNNAYYPSGGKSGVKDDQSGPYKSAIDDYKIGKDGNSLNTSPYTAWRDRFIYGVKKSGNLDKYYGETPSQEMVKNQVGGHKNGTVPSDQSMFLILSTIFNETGGRYYIDAPARGMYQMKGQFDSNRSDYYVVSMIGNPFFTVSGMLTQPMITLVVMVALVIALMSVGILDMNISPLVVAFKAMVSGDIEYDLAFLFYSLGIAGTMIMFAIMPSLVTKLITGISKLIVNAIPVAAGVKVTSPQQSLAMNGTPMLIQGSVGLAFGILWLKSEKFRNYLNEFFCYPWNWAKAAGIRLEHSANQNSYAIKAQAMKTRERVKNLIGGGDLMKKANRADGKLQNLANKTLGKLIPKDDMDPDNVPEETPTTTSTHENEIPQNGSSTTPTGRRKKPKTPEEIKRNGQFDRIDKDLSAVQGNPKTSRPTVDKLLDAQKAVDEFRKKPNEKNFALAKGRLEALKKQMVAEGAPKKDIANVDKAVKELDDLGKGYGINPDKVKTDKPVESENVETKDNDDSKIHVQPSGKFKDAQKAMDTFKKKPTAQNYATAKGQLENLKKQMIKDGAPKKDIAKVDEAIKGLDNSAKEHGIDPNKVEKPVESQHKHTQPVQTKKPEIKDAEIKSAPTNKIKGAQQAMDTFQKKPTAQNYATAKGQLENLKKQMIKDGAPKEDIAKVDKAIKGLDDSAKEHGIDPNKVEKPVESQHKHTQPVQPKKTEIKPQSTKATTLRGAQQAMDTFKKQPNAENFNSARDKLEGLKAQMVKGGAPKEDIAKVDKAIKTLDNAGQKHGIEPIKPTSSANTSSSAPTESEHQQVTHKTENLGNSPEAPKTTTIKSSDVQTTNRTSTQSKNHILKEAHKHEQIVNNKDVVNNSKAVDSEDTNSVVKNTKHVVDNLETRHQYRPVVNVTDTKETNRIVKNIVSDPEVHRTTRYVNNNQIKSVVSSLGNAAKDERVVKPLKQLYSSQNISDVKHSIRALQKSVRALDSNTKKQINTKNLINNLYNLQNKNKFGGNK